MKKLSESVWGDLRKKSLGQETREEDNVDLLDRPGFFEYLKSHYKVIKGKPQDDIGASMTIPVFNLSFAGLFYLTAIWYKKERLDTIWFYYREHSYLTQMESIIEPLKEFCKMVNFTKQPCKFEFSPKDGSLVSNSFLLRIIDTITENAQFPCLSKVMEESVWGDLRKKSLGQEKRLEIPGNVNELVPIDIGCSVLWADRDIVMDGETKIPFNEVSQFEIDGWRRPTRKEAKELFTNPHWKSNYDDKEVGENYTIDISHNGKDYVSFTGKVLNTLYCTITYLLNESEVNGNVGKFFPAFSMRIENNYLSYGDFAWADPNYDYKIRLVREK